MFEYKQPSKFEDLECLLHKVKVIDDVVSYNTTVALDKKYFIWIERHRDLIDELEYMIKEDLVVCESGE